MPFEKGKGRTVFSYVTIMRFVVPLAIAGFAVASEYSGLDVFLARLFFDQATQSWPLKSNFITAGVLHKGAQRLVVYFAVGLLLFIALSFLIKKLQTYRKGAGYLLLCTLLCTGIVALLKSITHIYTPWDLVLFGGDKPYIRLFDAVPPGLPVGHAFPGGHSSGGFAFVSLYFLLSVYRPRYRYYGLALGLGLGALFAITQELRGAHFLSHDLFSLVICGYVAWALYLILFRREIGGSPIAASVPEEGKGSVPRL